MKIQLKEITIREVTDGYINNDEEGVVAFGGKLDIRPKYQKEFIYKPKEQKAVIKTIQKNFPLNTMYWVVNKNGFEVLDGQQRSMSICEFVSGAFHISDGDEIKYFSTLTEPEQNQILDYKLMVYFCEGDDKEKIDWFKTINIPGGAINNQELRNAVYTGTWLSDAKRYFSRTGCPAYDIANRYVKGIPIRQDYLETAIEWISEGNIEQYMADYQHKPNANELWLYFQSVIHWVEAVFPNYRKEMKGIAWGTLYNEFKDKAFDSKKLEVEIARLMMDEDVTKKSGIYSYVLTRDEKYLNIREFSDNQKRESYERQSGICVKCKEHFDLDEMEADHIDPWHDGGRTDSENCQMLCKHDNRTKSGK